MLAKPKNGLANMQFQFIFDVIIFLQWKIFPFDECVYCQIQVPKSFLFIGVAFIFMVLFSCDGVMANEEQNQMSGVKYSQIADKPQLKKVEKEEVLDIGEDIVKFYTKR